MKSPLKKQHLPRLQPGRFGFAVYTPKFCPHAAKFVLALYLRSAFLTEPDFAQKPRRLQKPLQSRRDDIYVEARIKAKNSPVGAACVYCSKLRF